MERRLKGEPLAYVLGQWEFYGLTLTVTPDVLIPRDDTEAVCDLAISQTRRLKQNPRVLDLCAGTGCIGLAVASRIKDAGSPWGRSPRRPSGWPEGMSKIITCPAGSVWCSWTSGRRRRSFWGPMISLVSNPPYVTAEQMETLDPSVKNYEPRLALYGGLDGLDYYRAIAENYTPLLRPGGYICLEFGMGQEADVCHILMQQGYELGRIARDTGERARAVMAQKPNREEL